MDIKTKEELLENIEEDTELFGEEHVIYLARDEAGHITGYDVWPDEDFTEAVSLYRAKALLMGVEETKIVLLCADEENSMKLYRELSERSIVVLQEAGERLTEVKARKMLDMVHCLYLTAEGPAASILEKLAEEKKVQTVYAQAGVVI